METTSEDLTSFGIKKNLILLSLLREHDFFIFKDKKQYKAVMW